MKNTAKLLAIMILLIVSFSSLFAGCAKGPMLQPAAQDIYSIDPYGDRLHCVINNTYRASLNTPITAQVFAMSAENASDIPVNVTINGILFSTTAENAMYPDDMAHLRWGLSQGHIVKVKIEFFESGMTVKVKVSSLIQY